MSILYRIVRKFIPPKQVSVELKYTTNETILKERTALVIGGGTGIGKAIARKLQSSGCRVIIAGRKQRDTEFSFVKWDVSETEKLKEQFYFVIEQYGKIDILVNSQGICPDDDFAGSYNSITCQGFNDVMAVNLDSVYFLTVYAGEYFISNDIRGNILNIASTEGLKGSVVPYGISKAGVVSLTKGLGKQFARDNVTVNGIAPGATATDMMRIKENQNLMKEYLPARRMTTPEEIAEAALYLVSDMARNTCGQILVVDGGESLH